jgi:CHAD domain-containing protein
MAKAKEIEGLDCEAGAAHNIDVILRTRLQEMCALKVKALDWTDIEGVHGMRVASRRLRSALRDFAPYVDERKAPRRRLKALAASLGAVRDEDVAILALEKLRQQVDDEVGKGVDSIIEERRVRQARAREHLKEALSDEALDKLQEKFVSWLERATGSRKGSQDDTRRNRTFRQIGRETILSSYQDLDALSSSLFHPFDVEPLHLMRIASKRLRYAMELFAPCFGDELAGFAKEVAALQASLGELHDCDVWIAELGARLSGASGDEHVRDSVHRSKAPGTVQGAAVWLLQYFVKERAKHFRDALARWGEWEATDLLSRLDAHLQETRPLQPLGG